MNKILLAVVLGVFALSGCASVNSTISRSYDFNKIKNIGILDFNTQTKAVSGVEDLFTQRLMQYNFKVVERARIQQVLKANKITAGEFLTPDDAKALGSLMGVDTVLTGEVNYFRPMKKRAPLEVNQDIYYEPVYVTKFVHKADGTITETIVQSGRRAHKNSVVSGGTYFTSPKVGVITKLIDVETGEVIWVGSASREGIDAMSALQDAVNSLIDKFHKDIQK